MKNWSIILVAIVLFACKAKEKTQKTVETTIEPTEDVKFVKYKANNEDWKFKIYSDNTVKFVRAEKVLIDNMEIGSHEEAFDGGEQRFFTIADESILQYTIRYEECIDPETNIKYGRTVFITTNGENLMACLKSGNLPLNINQKWNLTKIAGIDNSRLNEMGEKPFIILNQEKGYINGSTGCNSLNGYFKIKENQVTFSKLATTKMGCPMMDVESTFVNAIQETNRIEQMDQRLVFFNQSEILLEFYLTED